MPSENADLNGWYRNSKRGISVYFGSDVVNNFCVNNDIAFVVRSHEVVQHGYESFGAGRLYTVFSASNYCGTHSNQAAIIEVCIDSRNRLVATARQRPDWQPPSNPHSQQAGRCPYTPQQLPRSDPDIQIPPMSPRWDSSIERPGTPPRTPAQHPEELDDSDVAFAVGSVDSLEPLTIEPMAMAFPTLGETGDAHSTPDSKMIPSLIISNSHNDISALDPMAPFE